MTTPTDETPRISDAQIVEIMRLLKGADTVELKVSIPTDAHRATIQGLPLDPVEAQPRQIWFFDTPDLALNQAGIVVRARRIQGGRGDTVIKLRPVVPSELPEDLRTSGSLNVEVDVLPGGFVCSASFKGRSDGAAINDAIAGKTPLRKLFSRDQRTFYAERAPAGLDLDSLVSLGPTYVLKGQFTPPELGRGSSPRCGSTRTARGSSSCRRSACRPRRSRSAPRPAPTSPNAASTWVARSRRRRGPRSTSSPTSSRPNAAGRLVALRSGTASVRRRIAIARSYIAA